MARLWSGGPCGPFARIAMIVFCLTAGSAPAVVLHPDSAPTERPGDGVVARWSTSATAVVIGPQWVLTTTHQSCAIGTAVQVDGATYYVSEFYDNPAADMRVARLQTAGGRPADLPDYVGLYTGPDECGQTAAIGGFGLGRGATLTSGGVPYGYLWSSGGNTTLRWGANRIDGIATVIDYDDRAYDVLVADFDDPWFDAYYSDLGRPEDGSVAGEGAVANHDSGCGYFVARGDRWTVAGLGRGLEHFGQTWFRNPDAPLLPDPDYLDALRVSPHADWIVAVTGGLVPGDADLDGDVDSDDYRILRAGFGGSGLTWRQGDFDRDGDADFGDYQILEANLGRAPGGGTTAPEPTGLLILVAGAALRWSRNRLGP